MNLRYAAALALVGWYLMLPTAAECVESDRGNKWPLMVPPTIKTDNGPKIDFNAPLNDWWRMGKYRSREDCERTRANWPTGNWTGQQVSHGKCVSIDDPRLKGK